MRLTIVTVGSRGDVQPYVALGRGLAGAGYTVTVATHAMFESFVRVHGLHFTPIAGDPQAVIGTPESERWLETGRLRDLIPAARRFRRDMPPLLDSLLADYWRIAQHTDAILFSVVAFPAQWAAEGAGLPHIAVWLQPLHPTGAFLPIGARQFHTASLGRPLNRLAYWLAYQGVWGVLRGPLNHWRSETLHLDPLPRFNAFQNEVPFPTLYGYSALVQPRPTDWPVDITVTGFWTLPPDATWQPDPALVEFLASGAPPVYMGFGSLTPQHAESLTSLVLTVLARTGQRAILGRGWGELGTGHLPPTVMRVSEVPHEWLFPQMSAIVHHGGAGTTAAALRAGVPSIVVPLGFDQPYWGSRVAALGVGPKPMPRSKLRVEWLTRALQQSLTDTTIRERAASLGRALRTEDGVANAVAQVQRLLER